MKNYNFKQDLNFPREFRIKIVSNFEREIQISTQ